MLVLVANKRTQVYVRNHDITLIGLVRERQRQGVLYWIKAKKKSQLYIFFLFLLTHSHSLLKFFVVTLYGAYLMSYCVFWLFIFFFFFFVSFSLQLCIISHYICLWKTNGIIQQLLTCTRKKLAQVLMRMSKRRIKRLWILMIFMAESAVATF